MYLLLRFRCGKWFARAEDDGSIERFLLAEHIPQQLKGSQTISALDINSVVPSPGAKKRSPRRDKESESISFMVVGIEYGVALELLLSDVKSSLLAAVNNVAQCVLGRSSAVSSLTIF